VVRTPTSARPVLSRPALHCPILVNVVHYIHPPITHCASFLPLFHPPLLPSPLSDGRLAGPTRLVQRYSRAHRDADAMAAPRSNAIQIVRPPENVKIETPEKPKKGECAARAYTRARHCDVKERRVTHTRRDPALVPQRADLRVRPQRTSPLTPGRAASRGRV
jgi:hypothetical protein